MNKILLIIFLTVFSFSSFAQAIEFEKPITAAISINKPAYAYTFFNQDASNKKLVTLMNIPLTRAQKQLLTQYPPLAQSILSTKSDNKLPLRGSVGMNEVPVLDQGIHGSCVTFANTAAIDALLNKGDYISQLCHLALGKYLEDKGYNPSGWDGSTGPTVLNQLISFGIINKNTQKTRSCGGLREYPILNANQTGNPMSLEDYKLSSENLNEHLFWLSLLNFHQRFQWESSSQANSLLIEIKKILTTQSSYRDSRLTFAVLLPLGYCSAGACASYHANEDTWALTKEIITDNNPTFGGHEMIIVGYDDQAIAIDHEGKKHQGLLILRNSWGNNAGDHGTYYMSYDFFKHFVFEVQQIIKYKSYSTTPV